MIITWPVLKRVITLIKFSQFKAKHGLSYHDVAQMFSCTLGEARDWAFDRGNPNLEMAKAIDIALRRYSKEYNINNSASHQVQIHNAEIQLRIVEAELDKMRSILNADIESPTSENSTTLIKRPDNKLIGENKHI